MPHVSHRSGCAGFVDRFNSFLQGAPSSQTFYEILGI